MQGEIKLHSTHWVRVKKGRANTTKILCQTLVSFSYLCQLSLVIQRTEGVELLQRHDQRLSRRRVHEIEVDQVVNAQTFQHEHNIAEICSLDLK